MACVVCQFLSGQVPLYYSIVLTVPRTHNRFGDRSFAVAVPRLWNSLQINLRQISSYGQFRRYLKNHLFGIWEITAQCDAWFSALYKYSYLLTWQMTAASCPTALSILCAINTQQLPLRQLNFYSHWTLLVGLSSGPTAQSKHHLWTVAVLRQLRSIRRLVSDSVFRSLVVSLVIPRFDYGSMCTSHRCCKSFTGCSLRNASISSWLCSFTEACMVWHHGISDYIQRRHWFQPPPSPVVVILAASDLMYTAVRC